MAASRKQATGRSPKTESLLYSIWPQEPLLPSALIQLRTSFPASSEPPRASMDFSSWGHIQVSCCWVMHSLRATQMQDAGRSDTGKVEEGTNFVGSLNGRTRRLGYTF